MWNGRQKSQLQESLGKVENIMILVIYVIVSYSFCTINLFSSYLLEQHADSQDA